MVVKRISSSVELAALVDQWNGLARDVPFRRWQWLFSWWRRYGGDDELFALSVRDDAGRLIALAPWRLRRSASRGRIVRCLGSGEVCSDYLTVLSSPEHEDVAAEQLARWLAEASTNRPKRGGLSNRWDLLELTGVDVEDRMMAKLASRLESEGFSIHRRPGASCWRLELPSTWEDYLGGLSKTNRKGVRRRMRRMFDGGRGKLHVVTRADQLDRGMRILVDLHQRRWRGLERPGCFTSSRFSAFLHEAARRMFQAKCLRLYWLELDGRPAAVDFHLVGGSIVYAYQAGVDPDALKYSAGCVSQAVGIQQAIEEGCSAFDFLRGDEAYKAHWGARPRPAIEIRVAARRAASRVRHGAWRAGRAMKDWIKGGGASTRPVERGRRQGAKAQHENARAETRSRKSPCESHSGS